MQLNVESHIWDEMHAATLRSGTTETSGAEANPAGRSPTLVARAAAGCKHTRAALLREIEDPCFRFCLVQLACRDAAREATQETALRILRSLGRYRGDASLTTWSLSIALNVCREHRRRKQWLPLTAATPAPDPAPDPSEQAQTNEQAGRLMASLQRLPVRQREAVTLRYLQGLSTQQTAQAMRCRQGTVKATLAKALNNLRQQWGHGDD